MKTLEDIVEEFLERHRSGESPSIEEYVQRFPLLGQEIRAALVPLALIEEHKPVSGSRPDTRDAPPLTEIGDYRLVAEIGRGGMGVVYEAEQKSLGRRVALKLLPEHLALNERALARFRREAQAAARMHHTNIVPVFEVGQDQGRVYYVMQRIDGSGLDQVIDALQILRSQEHSSRTGLRGPKPSERDTVDQPIPDDSSARRSELARAVLQDSFAPGRLMDSSTGGSGRPPASLGVDPPELVGRRPGSSATRKSGKAPSRSSDRSGQRKSHYRCVARLGLQAASALAYAHSRGIVHRDIKPSNLILDFSGVVWISDFGLAKAEEEGLTETGDFLGTIRYMSPERFRGECDLRADIYGLGLTLYELLSLQPGFDSTDRLQLIDAVANTEVRPLRSIDPRVPVDLETIIAKSINKDPLRRYASADELAEDLHRFLEDQPIKARRVSLAEVAIRWTRKHRALATSLLALALLLTFVAVASPLALIRESWLRSEAVKARKLAEDREREIRRNLYFAELNLAAQAARAPGGVGRVRELIAKWSPTTASSEDQRGWEWYFLYALCHRERLILNGPTNTIWSLDWSPDGTQVVASANDGSLTIWKSHTGEMTHRQMTHADSCVDWSPDGSRIVSTTFQGDVVVWDAAKLEELFRLGSHSSGSTIHSVQWSPDSQRLAWADFDAKMIVWDLVANNELFTFQSKSPYVSCLAWSEDGTRIATVGGGWVQVVDATSGRQLWGAAQQTAPIVTVGWSSDSQRIASSGQDGRILIWDASNGNLLDTWSAGVSPVWSVRWSPNSNRLASGHSDRTVRVWDVGTGKPIRTLHGHTDRILAIGWSPDGSQLASGGNDFSVRLWDVKAADQTSTLAGHRSNVTAIDWNPSGTRLASAGLDGSVMLWDPARSELIRSLSGHPPIDGKSQTALGVAWSPDNQRFASAGHDGTVRVWDAETGIEVFVLRGNDKRVWSVCWSPDSTRLAAAGIDGLVRIWDAASGNQVSTFNGHQAIVVAVDWSPDGRFLASASLQGGTGQIMVWNADTHEVRWESPPQPRRINCVRWSRDGLQLATGSSGLTVNLWDAASGQELTPPLRHTGPVNSIDWSPHAEHQRLAAASSNGTVRLWDLATRQLTLTLQTAPSESPAVRWNHDGYRLGASGGDTIYIWDASVGYLHHER